MTAGMVAPAWMHGQITVEQYESWSEEQCANIEIVDGMVVGGPGASKRHNRLARVLANALDVAAGPDWHAGTGLDVRLRDVPFHYLPDAPEAYGAMITRAKAAPAQSRSTDLGG